MSDSLATTETVAHQAPLSMGFPWHKYWNGLPFPSPGNLPDPRIEAGSPALASVFFTTKPAGESLRHGQHGSISEATRKLRSPQALLCNLG